MDWFDRILASGTMARLRTRVAGGGLFTAGPIHGSAPRVVSCALSKSVPGCVLLIVAHLDEADEALQECASLGVEAVVLPALEGTGATEASVQRLLLQSRLASPPAIIIASIAAIMQRMPPASSIKDLLRVLKRGETCPPAALMEWLIAAGYLRSLSVEEQGQFARRGGIIDLYPFTASTPLRIEFDGDEIERVCEIDLATQASDREVLSAVCASGADGVAISEHGSNLAELLPRNSVAVIADLHEVAEQGRGYWERATDARCLEDGPAVIAALTKHCAAVVVFDATDPKAEISLPTGPLPTFSDDIPKAMFEIAQLSAGARVTILCDTSGERTRADELLREHAPGAEVRAVEQHLHRGFRWEFEDDELDATRSGSSGQVAALSELIVPQHELLHKWGVRRRGAAAPSSRAREAFLHFEPGDHVVHRDHGIGRYTGLCRLPGADGILREEEYLSIEYASGAQVHVPLVKVALVQKYVGAGAAGINLSTLGGKRWKAQKEEVESAVRDMAGELLRVQAVRDSTSGFAFPADHAWQQEFEAEFPFEETPDQKVAIIATKRDMERQRPMDRLVCGDVGFGKTEIAVRAAFKAVAAGWQVAVLVPTTILAEQHERTFRDRFRAYPFRIECLSRFRSTSETRDVLEQTAAGKVDVLVGTHRLLSADVAFKSLGLIVVDEEQRFGVEHKQRLLQLRVTADVLTLSATPIPRTLHMAMLGLRDISSLTTPPLDRRAIVTEVIPFDEDRLAAALARELSREGQVFWVHNRVYDIDEAADRVRRLAPSARIAVGHGQMPDAELEATMVRFLRREADILVSTTIIESGLDIATANTMIIEQASHFGLSELHQLRGRIGRGSNRAYCYMLLPEGKPITADGLKRLRAIEDYSMLGAGFRIAVRDLEIRGAGNLLGAEQSGHIAAVGYEMYCQMLEAAVGDLRHEVRLQPLDTVVAIGLGGTIPRSWIPSDRRRLEACRRLGCAATVKEVETISAELESAYGSVPEAATELLLLMSVRIAATARGVRSIVIRDRDIVIRARRPAEVLCALAGIQGGARAVGQPDQSGEQDIYWRAPPAFHEPMSLGNALRRRFDAGS
ncbi:MAG: transcription-repair coupling factor [Phycisphaerales bacterium]|nr:transcription-repair coupling factor [Phycisphaerales bacterium]